MDGSIWGNEPMIKMTVVHTDSKKHHKADFFKSVTHVLKGQRQSRWTSVRKKSYIINRHSVQGVKSNVNSYYVKL